MHRVVAHVLERASSAPPPAAQSDAFIVGEEDDRDITASMPYFDSYDDNDIVGLFVEIDADSHTSVSAGASLVHEDSRRRRQLQVTSACAANDTSATPEAVSTGNAGNGYMVRLAPLRLLVWINLLLIASFYHPLPPSWIWTLARLHGSTASHSP